MKNYRKMGFTLVELMVVVAIIGILSAIAIPQFQTYQAKSKTSEAKFALAGIYTAQEGFYAQYDTYHSCLDVMGYSPPSERFYAQGIVGVSGIFIPESPNCATAAAIGSNVWPQTKPVGGAFIQISELPLSAISAGAFVGITCGNITRTHNGDTCSAGPTNPDVWTINQDKTIIHMNAGY